ncbi:MAG: trypsin-like peptidase domain-containing protein [Terriglobales bacterium]
MTQKLSLQDIPAIARAANGSIVSIVMSDKDGKPIAQASGFFVSKDGLIVTNYHVIAEGSSAVVKLPDGAFFPVDGVVASDKERDVAIIKAHGSDFRTLTLGDSARLQVGEEVVAIGNPLSLESTVSNGIVSAIRTVEEEGGKFLQITAPISHGSSGGPLFDMAGEVVGITSAGIKGGENLNFAIPINDVKPMISGVSKVRSARVSALPDEAEPDEAEPVTAAQTQGQRSFDELVNRKDKGIIGDLESDAAYVCFPPEEVGNDAFFVAVYSEPKEDHWMGTNTDGTLYQGAAAWFVFYNHGQRTRAAWAMFTDDAGWHVAGKISVVGEKVITKVTGSPWYRGGVNGFASSSIEVDGTEMRLHSSTTTLDVYPQFVPESHDERSNLPIDITIQLSTGRFVQATDYTILHRAGVGVQQATGRCGFYRHGRQIF